MVVIYASVIVCRTVWYSTAHVYHLVCYIYDTKDDEVDQQEHDKTHSNVGMCIKGNIQKPAEKVK